MILFFHIGDIVISLSVILSTFLLVFVAEIGDKTQLVAFSLTSSTRRPVLIFLASSSALVLSALMAVLLGGAALRVVPRFTVYVSAGLFVFFGLYILLSREMPRIKEGFLKAVMLEQTVMRSLPRVLRKAGLQSEPVKALVEQEQAHAELFRGLLRDKKLFRDDINDEALLPGLLDRMTFPRGIGSLSASEAMDMLLEKEDASIAFFQFLRDHLGEQHHEEPVLWRVLGELIEEERRHKEHLARIKERMAS